MKTISFQIFNNRLFLTSKSRNAYDLRGAISKHLTIKVKDKVTLKQVAEKLGFDVNSEIKIYGHKEFKNPKENKRLLIHFVHNNCEESSQELIPDSLKDLLDNH
jgi:hypothetical protein